MDKLLPQPTAVRHEPLEFRFPWQRKNDAQSKDEDRCGMTRAKAGKRIHALRREDGAVLKIGQMLRVGPSAVPVGSSPGLLAGIENTGAAQ